ncbi:MAG: hypothetical protein M3015_17290 [Bacteroidota bacterium]|nr:hypothetical protein [Bacteroidota bacterium]
MALFLTAARVQWSKYFCGASNQSDVIELAHNYKAFGVYILHGDSDKVVSVNYARQMRQVLGGFHADFSYYEYPGGEHWFGNQSVDWKPLFDFFKWHQLPDDSAVNNIDFTTASPGISDQYHWVSIQQQMHPLEYSHINLARDKAKNNIKGSTENIRLLKLSLNDFDAGKEIQIALDGNIVSYKTKSGNDTIFLLKENKDWAITSAPGADQKNPGRVWDF